MSKKSTNKSSAEILSDIGASLQKEVIDEANPSIERCHELIGALQDEVGADKTMTIALLQKSQIGITLGKFIKAIRRHKRNAAPGEGEEWTRLMDQSQQMLSIWKEVVKQETTQQKEPEYDESATGETHGLPTSVAEYRTRLTRQSKQLYKDPPALPPLSISIEERSCPLPKRDETSGLLSFHAGQDDNIKKLLKDFHPNTTPEEVLRAGSFGGTYFRPIVSAVTNIHYKAKQVLGDTVDSSWIEGLDIKTMLTSATYRPQVNKYGVKCGGSLGMWESSGWIADSDPYGWFQWYCRFYRGRRSSDDARQISRWLKSAGPNGRFRSQLCNKILAANAKHHDTTISPVIRQTLLHWGLEITPQILEQHKKRVK